MRRFLHLSQLSNCSRVRILRHINLWHRPPLLDHSQIEFCFELRQPSKVYRRHWRNDKIITKLSSSTVEHEVVQHVAQGRLAEPSKRHACFSHFPKHLWKHPQILVIEFFKHQHQRIVVIAPFPEVLGNYPLHRLVCYHRWKWGSDDSPTKRSASLG